MIVVVQLFVLDLSMVKDVHFGFLFRFSELKKKLNFFLKNDTLKNEVV